MGSLQGKKVVITPQMDDIGISGFVPEEPRSFPFWLKNMRNPDETKLTNNNNKLSKSESTTNENVKSSGPSGIVDLKAMKKFYGDFGRDLWEKIIQNPSVQQDGFTLGVKKYEESVLKVQHYKKTVEGYRYLAERTIKADLVLSGQYMKFFRKMD